MSLPSVFQIILFLSFVFIALVNSVYGCLCDQPREPTCALFSDADEVVAGKIVSIRNGTKELNSIRIRNGLEKDEEFRYQKVRVRIERQFKGSFHPVKEYFAATGHSCSLNIKVGQRWVFFLFNEPDLGVPIIANCQGSYPIDRNERPPQSLTDFGIFKDQGGFSLSSSDLYGAMPNIFGRAELFDADGKLIGQEMEMTTMGFQKLKVGKYKVRITFGYRVIQSLYNKDGLVETNVVNENTVFTREFDVRAKRCEHLRLRSYRN